MMENLMIILETSVNL